MQTLDEKLAEPKDGDVIYIIKGDPGELKVLTATYSVMRIPDRDLVSADSVLTTYKFFPNSKRVHFTDAVGYFKFSDISYTEVPGMEVYVYWFTINHSNLYTQLGTYTTTIPGAAEWRAPNVYTGLEEGHVLEEGQFVVDNNTKGYQVMYMHNSSLMEVPATALPSGERIIGH